MNRIAVLTRCLYRQPGNMGTGSLAYSWHKAVTLGLAIPMLFFTLGIPAVFAYLVGKRRQVLHTASCKEKMGYIYRAYR